jgi:O-antigen/teichoic acid export membrane protein
MLPSADIGVTRPTRPALSAPGHPVVGGAFMAIQFLALNVVGLFATAFMIRRLGALHYGEWATAAALAAAHLVMTSAGLRTIFVREVARRPHLAGDLLAAQLALRIALSVLAAGSVMTLSVVLRYPPVVIACAAVGCVWIVLSAIASTFGDLLQSLELFGSYSRAALAAGIIVTGCSVLAVSVGCGPVGLSIAYLTAPTVSTALYWLTARRYVDISVRWNTQNMRELLCEARLLGLNHIAGAVRDRAEQLLVPRMVGLQPFGLFSAGAMIGDRLANVPDAICTAFYPRISRFAHERFQRPLTPTVAAMLSVGLATSLPMAVGGSFLAESLASVLLPDARGACQGVIEVTVWAVPVAALSLSMSFALQAAGHHEYVARAGLTATAISAAASAALIAMFGIPGASWAVVFRPATLAVALLPAFRRTFPGVLAQVPFARILLCASALAAVCIAGERAHLWAAILFVAIGVCGYGVALALLGVFSIRAVVALIASPVHDTPVPLES